MTNKQFNDALQDSASELNFIDNLRQEQSKKFREKTEHCNSLMDAHCEYEVKVENEIVGDAVELEDNQIMLSCGRVIKI
ncbi:hypothetical protein [Francisella marina]|uniref:hypothetical protein n=1 Tax=Francisella marina TaxID=2249302 RepID=UPI0011F0328D|nr:hypothetical protein [Francisella marina]QEO58305.1 hypothetical protein F0R75_00410 [Francisella marina]